ncbi:hypothetical protein N7461_008755 [Penicillium sp. DV-2018c]|nr:hypothetical protein N7461_008755 [Penicillium sp. DV-2018c]
MIHIILYVAYKIPLSADVVIDTRLFLSDGYSIRARDVESDETQFFTPGEEDSPIRFFDQTDQLISTLDDYVSQRIVDDIDIPDSESSASSSDSSGHQAGLGGGGIGSDLPVPDNRPPETTNLAPPASQADPAPPAPEEDLILGDLPPTPELEPCGSPLPHSPPPGSPSNLPPPPSLPTETIVLVDDTTPDTYGYTPLPVLALILHLTPLLNQLRNVSVRASSHSSKPSHLTNSFQRNILLRPSLPLRRITRSCEITPSDAMDVEFNKLLQMNAFEPTPAARVRENHARECGEINQRHCIRHEILSRQTCSRIPI